MSPVNSLFMTPVQSICYSLSLLSRDVSSDMAKLAVLTLAGGFSTPFHKVCPLVHFPWAQQRSSCPEITQQGQWLNWTEHPGSGVCSVNVNRLWVLSSCWLCVPCENPALFPVCQRGFPSVNSPCQLLPACCSCLYLECSHTRRVPLCTSLFILDCINTELEFQVTSPAGYDRCCCWVSKVFLSSHGFFPFSFHVSTANYMSVGILLGLCQGKSEIKLCIAQVDFR